MPHPGRPHLPPLACELSAFRHVTGLPACPQTGENLRKPGGNDDPHPAAPLRQRIAEALASRVNGVASDGRGWFRTEEERQRFLVDADAVLAVVQPELDQARRDALSAAVDLAESVQVDTSADKALRATIVAKLRVEALTGDECAKCGHRRCDHLHHGGVCRVRRSSTTVCGCARYGHAVTAAAPKEA